MSATLVHSVYVHAPFCARRCFYCDFAVQVRRKGDAAEWLGALGAELRALADEGAFALADRLETLYVGGGTPSLLGPDAMAGLARLLGPARLAHGELEWTAEANPESLSAEVAGAWKRAGVNRLSLGVQTFHEPALRWMGRLHGPEGARTAVARARAAGFANLSVDLIFGLPAELGRSWRRDLAEVIELAPPHVSLYGLTVESGTPLGRAVREGRELPGDEEQYREEFLEAAERLTGAGYEHYEVSNFARAGHRSRHNAVYWEGAPYLGLGNGAHSYAPPLRRWNLADWSTYRDRALAGALPEEGRETVGQAADRLEKVWLALRTSSGWPLGDGVGATADLARAWARQGLAELDGGRVRLTPSGWLVLDRLALEMDAALSGADGVEDVAGPGGLSFDGPISIFEG